jgi:uncharacterized membrane protein YphA (DoxX/SURF4 family)
MKLLANLARTNAPRATLLIRCVTGWVFLSEGIQKFLYPEQLGVGRFIRIGIPAPEAMAPFVATVEIACGTLLLLGLLTRLAAVPLIVNMLVAIASTKIPILLNEGFWKASHESRTDLAMLCCSLFLLALGAGPLSLDWRWLTSGRGGQRVAGKSQ